VEALEDRCVPAAITLIQNIGAVASTTAGATSLSIPVTQAVAAGHLVTVEFAALKTMDANLGATPTITDTAGNTYSTNNDFSLGFPSISDLYFIASTLVSSPIPVGGAITVTFDASFPARAASAQEFYGLSSIPHFYGTSQALDSTGTATTLPAGYNIDQAPALALASFLVGDTPANTLTLDPASTRLPGAGTTTATPNVTIAPGYRVVTTTGGTSITGTLASPAYLGSLGSAFPGDPTTHFEIDAAPTATAGNVLTVTVKALDALNAVDPGYTGTVHFGSSDARAALPDDVNFTPADAGVKKSQVTLYSAGPQTITADDTVDGTVLGSANVTVQPGPLHHFQIAAPAGATAGAPFSFVVTALDAANNVVPSYTGTVQFTGTDRQATLPFPYAFTIGPGGDNGVHTFTGVTLRTAGVQTIGVSDMTNAAATGSTPVAVSPAAAAVLDVAAPSTVTAGVAFALTVTVRDTYGNVVTGYRGTVQLTSSDRKAALPGKYTFSSADQGVHTFSVTLQTAGTQSITVTDVGSTLLIDIVEIQVTKKSKK
jgi:hypothetical protein